MKSEFYLMRDTETLNNCSDQGFISPIFIPVKRNQNIKLALDSIVLNKSIHK